MTDPTGGTASSTPSQGRLRAGLRGHLRRRHPRPGPVAAPPPAPVELAGGLGGQVYRLGDGTLRLVIEADQPPRCPEFDGQTRVSSLQTGVFAGPVGSPVGQSRFADGLVVRQAQDNARLFVPQYGLFELRAGAVDDPRCMV